MNILSIMTVDTASCGADDSLNRAAQLMWEHDCGCIPVTDAERRVVGIVTDRDACMAAYTKGAPLSAIRVGDVMSRHVECCGPDEDVATVEKRMQQHQIRRMPVVEARKLIGIVSLNDIALEAHRTRGDANGGPRPEDVALTLAVISQHRQHSEPTDLEY
jgi:CBS domain-containing protein